MITITGAGDHDPPDWLITMTGMLEGSTRSRDADNGERPNAGRR
jgi:hypothetical protein